MLAELPAISSQPIYPSSFSAPAVTAPAAALPVTTATDMKRQGWRSVMARVRRDQHLLITNHNTPEAVILAPEEYDRLVRAARQNEAAPDAQLQALQAKFRARLQCLQTPEANEKLAGLMASYPQLNGQVLAGVSH